MTYYVAVLIDRGAWAETFGDRDKECVDFEVQCWREDHSFLCGECVIARKSFRRVPTQNQLNEWVHSLPAYKPS